MLNEKCQRKTSLPRGETESLDAALVTVTSARMCTTVSIAQFSVHASL